MKTALAIYGAMHIFLTALGAIGMIDYHLCVKDVGKCVIGASK